MHCRPTLVRNCHRRMKRDALLRHLGETVVFAERGKEQHTLWENPRTGHGKRFPVIQKSPAFWQRRFVGSSRYRIPLDNRLGPRISNVMAPARHECRLTSPSASSALEARIEAQRQINWLPPRYHVNHDAANSDHIGRMCHAARGVPEKRGQALYHFHHSRATANRARTATRDAFGMFRRKRPTALSTVTTPDASA